MVYFHMIDYFWKMSKFKLLPGMLKQFNVHLHTSVRLFLLTSTVNWHIFLLLLEAVLEVYLGSCQTYMMERFRKNWRDFLIFLQQLFFSDRPTGFNPAIFFKWLVYGKNIFKQTTPWSILKIPCHVNAVW